MTTNMQVLLVDDEPLARARLRTLLGDCRSPGAEVAGEAANAKQAPDLLRRPRFAVAIAAVEQVAVRQHDEPHLPGPLIVHEVAVAGEGRA